MHGFLSRRRPRTRAGTGDHPRGSAGSIRTGFASERSSRAALVPQYQRRTRPAPGFVVAAASRNLITGMLDLPPSADPEPSDPKPFTPELSEDVRPVSITSDRA